MFVIYLLVTHIHNKLVVKKMTIDVHVINGFFRNYRLSDDVGFVGEENHNRPELISYKLVN